MWMAQDDRPRRSAAQSRRRNKAIAAWTSQCDNSTVYFYGPYPPSKGRTKWRVTMYDPDTQRKKSLMADSKKAAESLIHELKQQNREKVVLSVHQAVSLWIDAKLACWKHPRMAKEVRERIESWIPDVAVTDIEKSQAHELYVGLTKTVGRFGVLKPATHHARLKATKEFWRWLVQQEYVQSSPWEQVKPIGTASAGKKQLRGKDARALERTLFGLAETGDEGALAILVQLYLGLRPGEVLGLLVGALDGNDVYVDGTKNKNAKRRLELYPEVAQLLQRHCNGRPDHERIFAASLPQKPTTTWMYKRLHRYCDQAQIERVCPHSLRGLHSSLAIEAGATSHDVARALGHSSFEITKKHYASPESIDSDRLRKIRQALHDES